MKDIVWFFLFIIAMIFTGTGGYFITKDITISAVCWVIACLLILGLKTGE